MFEVLILTTSYSALSERANRKTISLMNVMSCILSRLYVMMICTEPIEASVACCQSYGSFLSVGYMSLLLAGILTVADMSVGARFASVSYLSYHIARDWHHKWLLSSRLRDLDPSPAGNSCLHPSSPVIIWPSQRVSARAIPLIRITTCFNLAIIQPALRSGWTSRE